MRTSLICFLLAALSYVSVSAQDHPSVVNLRNQAPLTNRDVVTMVKAKFSDAIIVKTILANRTNFDVSVQGLLRLQNVGVSPQVIDAMLSAAGGKNRTPAMVTPSPVATPEPDPAPAAFAQNHQICDALAKPLSTIAPATKLASIRALRSRGTMNWIDGTGTYSGEFELLSVYDINSYYIEFYAPEKLAAQLHQHEGWLKIVMTPEFTYTSLGRHTVAPVSHHSPPASVLNASPIYAICLPCPSS